MDDERDFSHGLKTHIGVVWFFARGGTEFYLFFFEKLETFSKMVISNQVYFFLQRNLLNVWLYFTPHSTLVHRTRGILFFISFLFALKLMTHALTINYWILKISSYASRIQMFVRSRRTAAWFTRLVRQCQRYKKNFTQNIY